MLTLKFHRDIHFEAILLIGCVETVLRDVIFHPKARTELSCFIPVTRRL